MEYARGPTPMGRAIGRHPLTRTYVLLIGPRTESHRSGAGESQRFVSLADHYSSILPVDRIDVATRKGALSWTIVKIFLR